MRMFNTLDNFCEKLLKCRVEHIEVFKRSSPTLIQHLKHIRQFVGLRWWRGSRATGPRPSRIRPLAGTLPRPLVRRGASSGSSAATQLRVGRPGRTGTRLVVLVALGSRLGLTETPRRCGRRWARCAAFCKSAEDACVAATCTGLRRGTVRYRGGCRLITAINILATIGSSHLLWGWNKNVHLFKLSISK